MLSIGPSSGDQLPVSLNAQHNHETPRVLQPCKATRPLQNPRHYVGHHVLRQAEAARTFENLINPE
jgi:hypothetical protein